MLFPARFAHARYSTGMIDRFLNWGDHGKPKSGKIKGRCQLPCTEVYNNHVRKARQEREFYNACIKTSAEELASLPEVPSGPQQPCSQEFNTHYTFDFAMSFTLPHQCLQVGPLYFLTTLKVHCFGICCEAAKKQVNFLFSEGDSIGTDGKKSHGPNNVLSMLHYLCDFSLGEKNAVFHADYHGCQRLF